MKRKLLIDLSVLHDLYCGLGQVALAYGRYFEKNYRKETAEYELTLLVPEPMVGEFGSEVEYISSSRKWTKRLQFLLPKFDVWHSIHQLSRFRPNSARTKHIFTVHDLNYLYERRGFNKLSKHIRTQLRIDRANEIVCISEFAKSEVEQHMRLHSKQCKMIYNGVEILDPAKAISPKIEINRPFFFSIGVVQKKKNFHVLLDLMKLMPDRHLYIAGKLIDWPEKDNYAQMIKSRIEDENIVNVTLLGPVSHREKIWLYDNCEAFLFPSLFEGFGLPIIEAMQFGKPVFSSKETSLKEIGGKFAYFWDDFEPKCMKSVIENNLASFYQDDRLALEEKEYASSFSYERHFEEYEKLYTRLMI